MSQVNRAHESKDSFGRDRDLPQLPHLTYKALLGPTLPILNLKSSFIKDFIRFYQEKLKTKFGCLSTAFYDVLIFPNPP